MDMRFGYVIMRLSLWIFLGIIVGLFPFKEATATFLGLAIWTPVGLLRRKSSTATVNKKETTHNSWSMERQYCHITWLVREYYKISHGYHMSFLYIWPSHDITTIISVIVSEEALITCSISKQSSCQRLLNYTFHSCWQRSLMFLLKLM